jgi:hypothetical protein
MYSQSFWLDLRNRELAAEAVQARIDGEHLRSIVSLRWQSN